ncbi:DUF4132 domain-containing protein [Actinomadura rugatobispora]|uniref:DUF4132 domain-containing protein n=1 Tax=Actinomadura rugatobispora TaxID=1994 RepID=A0ABW1A8Q9_9ACTN|nr:hypothetical protein GCM10010200_005460 [Actinomadura rugatobispora]
MTAASTAQQHTYRPAGEDAPHFPDGWRRHLHPRRGGGPGPQVKVAKGAPKKVRAWIEQAGTAFEALAGEHGDPDLAGRARRHLEGDPDPAGAAVAALVTGMEIGRHGTGIGHPEVFRTFVDSWVVGHGPAFAACAVVELTSVQVDRKGPDGPWIGTWIGARRAEGTVFREDVRESARRVRGLLAVAGDAEYREAIDRLAGLRDSVGRRLAVSYLVPTRYDWVDECCAEPHTTYGRNGLNITLLHTIGTAEHVRTLGGRTILRWGDCSLGLLATLLDGLGTDALPVLQWSLDHGCIDSAHRKRLLEVVTLLPGDEPFQALIDRLDQEEQGKYARAALLEAMDRFPARAVRLLSAAAAGHRSPGGPRSASVARDLLAGHLVAHPEPAAAVAPELPEESRALIASLAGAAARVPDASADALPPLLVEPPWTRTRKAAKPVVVAGRPVPGERSVRWAEGERDAWAVRVPSRWSTPGVPESRWAEIAKRYAEKRGAYDAVRLIADGPEDLARPLLAEWEGFYWDADDVAWMRTVVARYEVDALPLAMRAGRQTPGSCGRLLLPYLSAEVATLMADWLARVKSARQTAMAYFERHGTDAARLLVPAALGKAGPARRQAEGALLLVAARAGAEAVESAAREHGDPAAAAVAALLATDPLDRLPVARPKPVDWADPGRLPQVLLRGRDRALPAAATGHLVTMLAMSRLGEVYAGVDVVREACDPASLAEFSWALFQEWELRGAPSKDGWALEQPAWLGDDDTVRRLTPVIRAWPGDGGHHKAVKGLDVLAAIGTDTALLHLHGIAQKVKFKALKGRAQEKIAEVAAGLGLGAEELADRLVPDFGLDADGGLTLDYGPRRFVVGFDEVLKPYVTDEDGKRRKALPKPGTKDDEELASAAYKRFAGLKKDVRTVAADQVSRLESAMVARRRWTPEEFRTLFAGHPLVWHIARRLVWIAEPGEGAEEGAAFAFRIAEDRTFADVSDDAAALPAGASIGIAHPLDLGGDVAAWSEVFADYEITQPFPQLGREAYTLTAEERAAGRLERFEGVRVPVHTVLGLVRRGWSRGEPLDAGGERWISRPVPGGLHVVIDLDPGISVGWVEGSGEQTLRYVWLNDHPTDFYRGARRHTFGGLDPVAASEVVADLTWLSAAAL